MFFSGFSFKNRHFRHFCAIWRHFAPFPVMSGTWHSSIYYVTCVGDLRLLLFFICMCFSQVFSKKTPFPHIDATFASFWRHFRWSLVPGAHQCVGWYNWVCFPEKKSAFVVVMPLFLSIKRKNCKKKAWHQKGRQLWRNCAKIKKSTSLSTSESVSICCHNAVWTKKWNKYFAEHS